MKTTVTIEDDELLEAARNIAQARSVSLGRVLTDLARQGLASVPEFDRRPETGFPTLRVSPGGASPFHWGHASCWGSGRFIGSNPARI